jgi:hypothetical protein
VVPKRVDSSSVSQKPCPALVFKGWGCGKTEEGSGKKGDGLWSVESKKAADLSTFKNELTRGLS